MEFVENIKDPEFTPDWSQPIEEIAKAALHYAHNHLRSQLVCYRVIKPELVDLDHFWGEYIWCVYTSGFNARVVSKMYPKLWDAYRRGPPLGDLPFDAVGMMIQPINSNRQKFKAIKQTAFAIQGLGWSRFQEKYLRFVDTIPMGCSYIGNVTKYHLGRNIGLDCVKPDLHLVRLAKWYGWGNPTEMCHYLAEKLEERVGVIDFILWAYCAAYGTKELDSGR